MTYGNEDLGVVKRITVTLDDETHQLLQEWADSEARTVPNLLAYLALKAIKEKQQEQESKGK
jgi:predicted transcriptional regulator